ncbi:hypothetical protein SFBM_0239 [Candidatus Arthromitus sp. SFB-mouse-Japan]|uniref:hypothetical protein n=1 Tax=unclassified Candidatus Neoarthromitus TaxID=2638829 RepID=UPI00021B7D0F|nr:MULTISPECIES: hypothetical protein [unclassified Candidatus Arthromitus]EIA23360.1 hypothetical protein SFB1_179G2 [Candidatus Arthromitus sp. SFB-1]EIA25724.1 hypothetical protein SFB4_302G1 [Candidatus Arthromitus sp. SFB-4]EIA26464.1 hypothetical protein SFB3_021G1 [Candidatus Arthromitus sp. SFB-3]EIA27078.1 hypothetical protein SFB6_124G32 [Candidatus Arthromitus sp. SFB-co]EIA31208.1 hypothetical protein SFBSU_003G63 [Candidatus Arthromitus sp. SFB-mouse-SU]EIA31580.1 hypothetical pr
MKYFKLGLLAVTLSLTALIIALDKKESKKSINEQCNEEDVDTCESPNAIVIEE